MLRSCKKLDVLPLDDITRRKNVAVNGRKNETFFVASANFIKRRRLSLVYLQINLRLYDIAEQFNMKKFQTKR